MELTTTAQKFILHWGEMGSRWGINRTVAQIHALLYLSTHPLNAEEISETLAVARSTVSAGLHELQSWGIVNVVHVLGDRRDHFETSLDVWSMFRLILDERKRRELDPTLVMLREAVTELEAGGLADDHAREKLQEMLDFFETVIKLYEQVHNLPLETILRLAKMSDFITRLQTLG
jgi:DNA-binding transcriptional regulator GbsR (MarR family)